MGWGVAESLLEGSSTDLEAAVSLHKQPLMRVLWPVDMCKEAKLVAAGLLGRPSQNLPVCKHSWHRTARWFLGEYPWIRL